MSYDNVSTVCFRRTCALFCRIALLISIVCGTACTGNVVLQGATALQNGNSPFATYPLGNGPTQNGNNLGLAIYWGQNDGPGVEPDLATVCTQPQFAQYNEVIISFVTAWVNTRNGNPNYPEMDLSNHCTTPYDANDPYLLKCDDLAAAIQECQQAGKKVLLSMGGAVGNYNGFPDDANAQAIAQSTWDMFLGGNGNVRPFDGAVLDGIDLDIEHGATTGYAAYVQALRQLMNSDPNKTYWITAAPQCPYPDAYLGPGTGLAFTDAIQDFDAIWVQFYNNYCEYRDPQAFQSTFLQWAQLTSGGPRLFIGLPDQPGAADAASYVEPLQALPPLIESAKRNGSFRGVMLWDVGFDVWSGATGQDIYSLSVEQNLQH